MPALGSWHPQVVHFVVASLFVGLPLYWLAFVPRARFLRSGAVILLIVGTGASWVAVRSGLDAHESVEDIPGIRAAVTDHEEMGERTRTVFSALLAGELLAFLLGWYGTRGAEGESAPGGGTARLATGLRVAVAIGWAAGAGVLFETAEHGGALVYEYGGGPGLRNGENEDVARTLLAGLFNESRIDRADGRHDDAARLVEEMARRFPDNPDIQLLRVESLVLDRKDGRAALDAVAGIGVANAPARTQLTAALLRSQAYELLQLTDSARAVLEALPEAQRASGRVARQLQRLGG